MRIRAALDSDAAALVGLLVQAERAHADLVPDYFRAGGGSPAVTVPAAGGA